MRAFWLIAAALSLAGCAGGGSSADPPPPVSIATPPPPAPPEHTCPPGQVGNPCAVPAPPVPVLPPCAIGITELYAAVCVCPAMDVNGGNCVVPTPAPPADCPVGTTPAPLPCLCPPAYLDATDGSCIVPAPPVNLPPTMSLTATPAVVQSGQVSTLAWTSSGAVGCLGAGLNWPVPGQLAWSGSVATPQLFAPTSYSVVCSGGGGNAVASVTVQVGSPAPPPPPGCPAGQVLIGGVCSLPPTLAVTLAIEPPTVSDSSAGCPPPSGAPCAANLTVTAVSSLAGDAVLCTNGAAGNPPSLAPYVTSVGPYPALQDGPAVVNASCQDTYGVTASASIVLEVIAPGGPAQPDTFAGVLSGNIFAGTWTTYSVQGAGGCSIQQANSGGLLVTLNPGGTPSGSASSGFLSPSGDPYTFSLICSGAPANVPQIVVSP